MSVRGRDEGVLTRVSTSYWIWLYNWVRPFVIGQNSATAAIGRYMCHSFFPMARKWYAHLGPGGSGRFARAGGSTPTAAAMQASRLTADELKAFKRLYIASKQATKKAYECARL